MDFADILNQWDARQKNAPAKKTQDGKSHKKANAPTKEEKEAMRQGYSLQEQAEHQMQKDGARKANPMTVWLNRYGTVDKDKVADQAEERARMSNREYLHDLRPQATIDLHGLTRDEAWPRLEAFVSTCHKRGLKKILIIHGKGNHSTGNDPVLGPMVRLFIEQDKRLGLSGHPDRNNGGNGATWVLIK